MLYTQYIYIYFTYIRKDIKKAIIKLIFKSKKGKNRFVVVLLLSNGKILQYIVWHYLVVKWVVPEVVLWKNG